MPTQAIAEPPIKTYVLIGHDMARYDDIYSEQAKTDPNLIIIHPKPGETAATIAAQIVGPANIILHCHGKKEGTFQWNKDDWKPYGYLFAALPRSGIVSISLGSCYGGIAQADEALTAAPPGCIVQSMTGPKTPNLHSISLKFSTESTDFTNKVSLFLEMLDNFNPTTYKDSVEYLNQKDGTNDDTDPNHALPHILGLGGNPPKRIDLAAEMKNLSHQHDAEAMKRTIERVQNHFDTDSSRPLTYFGVQFLPSLTSGSLGPEAEKKLDQDIADMAAKLQQGYVPANVEEKRLAYAITAAYLDESGELKRMIEAQPGYAEFGTLLLITEAERTYLYSAREQLKDNPALQQIIGDLTKVFKQSAGNDSISNESPLGQQLQKNGLASTDVYFGPAR